MNEDVLYSEPSYNIYKTSKSPQYIKMNEGYMNIVKYGNVKYAMVDLLKNPPPDFEEVIKVHFYLNKKKILETCNHWLK